MFFKHLERGEAGDNAGILLRVAKKDYVERGKVLVKPGLIRPHDEFNTAIYILKKKKVVVLPILSKAINRNSILGRQM